MNTFRLFGNLMGHLAAGIYKQAQQPVMGNTRPAPLDLSRFSYRRPLPQTSIPGPSVPIPPLADPNRPILPGGHRPAYNPARAREGIPPPNAGAARGFGVGSTVSPSGLNARPGNPNQASSRSGLMYYPGRGNGPPRSSAAMPIPTFQEMSDVYRNNAYWPGSEDYYQNFRRHTGNEWYQDLMQSHLKRQREYDDYLRDQRSGGD